MAITITALKKVVTKLILSQTALSRFDNEGRLELSEVASPLSDKAEKAQELIRTRDFGCANSSVAELVSVLIEEKITAPDKDQDELKLNILQYTLLEAVENNNNVEIGDFVLKMFPDADNVNSDPEEELKRCNWHYLSSEGCLEIVLADSDVSNPPFRIASDADVQKFVRALPAPIVKQCFSHLEIFAE